MSLKLEIIHLQMIKEIADAGTITKAAETLCITQSALSRRISEAERRLNITLFEKKNKKLYLTTAGQRLLFSADKILKELSIAENDLNARFQIDKELVTIGMEPYSCHDWLAGTLDRTNIRNSADKIDIRLNVTLDPIASLKEGDIDLAILPKPEQDDDLNMTPLFTDKLVAVLPRDHVLNSNEQLSTQDFADETYIAHNAGLEISSEYDRFFNDQSLNPKKTIHIGMVDAVISLVSQNYGFTILSERTVKPYLINNAIIAIPLTGTGTRLEWYAVSKAGNEQVKSMQLERIIREVSADNTGA
ncbi:LysR family transcriptional regulator [Pseudemcibacter aquimaris]|uniref:LysR family transcriptional regulator n=1 Tax=Pseudemcibacter aquimaris TaxID=2857064 RepID=UPI0020122A3E|nr:LysR family transcriptional regulator [Pseudemcibacter aquimaris]MCC3861401.1 LysR family transcriptional regulator [Pseudemcibacter aquimaris]WDU58171.1 LysR family transcriptional regulator [Pseudemcibacter aquimaris]